MNITNSAEIEKLTCLADSGDLKAIKCFPKAADQLNDDELDELTYL